jgi:hypothetical protein
MNSEPTTHNQPSARARELLRGAYDLHLHIEPDVIKRRITDVQLARRFAELGMAGFVLKSHYVPTAERAAAVREAVPGINVMGAIVLNNFVGGMNAAAVEIAARGGARTVWMPTVDAANEEKERTAYKPGAKPPLWLKLQQDLIGAGIALPPVRVVDDDGALLPETRKVIEVAAKHQMMLATGHLGRDEIFSVVDAALAMGVRDVVVTHPDYPTQNISIEDQIVLANKGAWLERCFTTAHTGKIGWARLFEIIRATSIERTILSTDLGQPANPPVEDGLAIFADRLLEAGFCEDEVHTMAVTNSIRLAGEAR